MLLWLSSKLFELIRGSSSVSRWTVHFLFELHGRQFNSSLGFIQDLLLKGGNLVRPVHKFLFA